MQSGSHSLAVALLLISTAVAAGEPLSTVESLDLERYQGTWHEIARLPNRFQDQCVEDITAEYRLQENGRVEVTNRCRRADGSMDTARGEARRPDPHKPGVLEVRFAPRWLAFLPFVWGDYRVFHLDSDYTRALVGSGDREYLWLLARDPNLPDAEIRRLLEIAAGAGFDVGSMIRTGGMERE